jgi:methyl-accepting chemotaxis protein
MASVDALTRFTIMLAAAATIIMSVITYFIAYRIAKPIVDVSLTLKDISE